MPLFSDANGFPESGFPVLTNESDKLVLNTLYAVPQRYLNYTMDVVGDNRLSGALVINGALSGVSSLSMGGALSGVTTIAASGTATLSSATAPLTLSGATAVFSMTGTDAVFSMSGDRASIGTQFQRINKAWLKNLDLINRPTVGEDVVALLGDFRNYNSSQWITSGSDIYYSLGKVGIGITPSTTLHAYATGGGMEYQGGANNYFEFIDRNNPDAAVNTSFYTKQGNFAFYTGAYTERLKILNNGNVGIGTTSPSYKLDLLATPPANGGVVYIRDTVSLGSDSFAAIGFTSSPGYDWYIGKATTSAGAGLFQIRDQDYNVRMSISENGNVGIGRTPTTYKCEIEGSSLITNKLYLGTTTAPATDTGTLNALVWDNTTGEIKQRGVEFPLTFQHSVIRSTNTVNLSGDIASPGSNKYYGTNSSGTRGWYSSTSTDYPVLVVSNWTEFTSAITTCNSYGGGNIIIDGTVVIDTHSTGYDLTGITIENGVLDFTYNELIVTSNIYLTNVILDIKSGGTNQKMIRFDDGDTLSMINCLIQGFIVRTTEYPTDQYLANFNDSVSTDKRISMVNCKSVFKASTTYPGLAIKLSTGVSRLQLDIIGYGRSPQSTTTGTDQYVYVHGTAPTYIITNFDSTIALKTTLSSTILGNIHFLNTPTIIGTTTSSGDITTTGNIGAVGGTFTGTVVSASTAISFTGTPYSLFNSITITGRQSGKHMFIAGRFKITSNESSVGTARFLYTISNYQNPGATVYFPVNALQIAEGAYGYIDTSGNIYIYYGNAGGNTYYYAFNVSWIGA